MELRQLAYLVEVARTGTFSAAAASLSVAQPALWRQVKDLERELGLPLFERVGRRVRLTHDGEAVVGGASGVLAAAEHLRTTAEDLRTGRAGVVSIACAAPHLREFLAPVIAALRAAHPRVEVRVREYGGGGPGPGPGMKADLLAGTVDVATGVGPAEAGLETFPIYDVRLLVAVPDDHPWRDDPVIEVRRLRGQPLVVSQQGSFSRAVLVAACARAGFEPTIGFDSPNPLSILALGEAGLGFPVLLDGAAPAPVERPWPALAEGGRVISNTMRLGWRAGATPSAAVSAFIELARAEAARRAVIATA
jgi:DNA-binding transcriptional LysR family regulator